MKYVIGCDIGTQGAKALVVDGTGKVVAKASAEYPLSTPKPGWAEQDPEDWVKEAAQCIREALRACEVSSADIVALGLSGQMHSSVFLDAAGRVIRPAILWCDTRTQAECREIEQRLTPSFLRKTVGNPALEGFTLPKILWLRKNEPENYKRVVTLFLPKDYVRWRWTGERSMEISDAAGTLALDIRKRTWAKELLRRLHIPLVWFPPVKESAEVCGRLRREAAQELGLAPGLPVVGGGADNPAAAVGCGVIDPGEVLVSLGTSGVVYAPAVRSNIDPKMRLHAFCSCLPGGNYFMGVMLSAGYALRWFRDTLAQKEKEAAQTEGRDAYDLLMQEAAQAPIGSEGLFFLPYLMGERTPHRDADARGAWIGLDVRHKRAHLVRSVLEGVAFGLRDSFEILRTLGTPVRRVVVTGGGSKSALWRRILADVLNHDIWMVQDNEGPAYGAALLAWAGTQGKASLSETCRKWVKPELGAEKRLACAREYDTWYKNWRKLYPTLKKSFRSIRREVAAREKAGGRKKDDPA